MNDTQYRRVVDETLGRGYADRDPDVEDDAALERFTDQLDGLNLRWGRINRSLDALAVRAKQQAEAIAQMRAADRQQSANLVKSFGHLLAPSTPRVAPTGVVGPRLAAKLARLREIDGEGR